LFGLAILEANGSLTNRSYLLAASAARALASALIRLLVWRALPAASRRFQVLAAFCPAVSFSAVGRQTLDYDPVTGAQQKGNH
ncbi:MAG TPA: hypothetical protein VHK26_09805, partial [Methyloceanibacter sp.]|nr:hypothetical protein [Methyloceanibacter sp.]